MAVPVGIRVGICVGIRELRARLASHLETVTPIAVTQLRRAVGLHGPLPQGSDQSERERLPEAGRLMHTERQRLDLTEEELAADFKDWRRAQQQQAHSYLAGRQGARLDRRVGQRG